MIGVGLVSSVAGEPGSDVEETAICNGILIPVAVVEREDLPTQTSATLCVDPLRLCIEDCLGQGEPGGMARIWVSEVHLSCQ